MEENRKKHELELSGSELTEEITKNNGLDMKIFTWENLNKLSLTNSCLDVIPEEIGNLKNMSKLALQSNKIVNLPQSLMNLGKLTYLDVSNNQLSTLPDVFTKLENLELLNLSTNKLTEMPNLEKCTRILHVDLGYNKIESFKDLCSTQLSFLNTLLLPGNNITTIPLEVSNLSSLKVLSLAENKITLVYNDILQAPKLKELNLFGNPLSDKRFKKLVEQKRTQSKQVLDYIRKHSESGKTKEDLESAAENLKVDEGPMSFQISVLTPVEELVIHVRSEAKKVRPHLVSCVLKNIDLSGNNFNRFINLQTRLHEGLCDKRMAATIATHALSKVKFPLWYDARSPGRIRMKPLGNDKECTATELYKRLHINAENARKMSKRNSTTGIYKYIHLVKGWQFWPFIMDATENVVSLPPLTNADNTKLSAEPMDVLMEVTSSTCLQKCKDVMDQCILETLEAGIFSDKDTKTIQVQQVRVIDESCGSLRVLYPSRVDLDLPGVCVTRE